MKTKNQKGKGIFTLLIPLIASAIAGATQSGGGKVQKRKKKPKRPRRRKYKKRV